MSHILSLYMHIIRTRNIHLSAENKQLSNQYCVQDLIAEMEGNMKCLFKLVLLMVLIMAIMVSAGAVETPPSCCPEVVECCGFIAGVRKTLPKP